MACEPALATTTTRSMGRSVRPALSSWRKTARRWSPPTMAGRARSTPRNRPAAPALDVVHLMSLVRLRLDPLALEAGIAVGGAVRLTKPNAEHDLKGPQAMAGLLVGEPALLEPTHEGAARCTFDRSEIRYPSSAEKLPDGKTSGAWLREHTLRGARERFPGAGTAPPAVLAQNDCALARIDELDSGGYFLTMWGSSATAGARRSSARAAARQRARWSATASGSRRSIRLGSSCCSSDSCHASDTSRPTSTSTSAHAAR